MDYHYTVIPSPQLSGQPTSLRTTNNRLTYTGLKNGVDYTFRVKATNQIGLQSISKPSAKCRPLSRPHSKIRKLECHDTMITVNFDDSGQTKRDIMCWYELWSEPKTFVHRKILKSPVVFQNLENGREYKFFLKAINNVAESPVYESAYIMPLQTPCTPEILDVWAENRYCKVRVRADFKAMKSKAMQAYLLW
eukprot:UN23577